MQRIAESDDVGLPMRRIGLAVVLTVSLTLAPLAAEAQESKAGRTVTRSKLLRQRGYVEGQNLVIKYQWAEGQQDRYPVLARELVRLKPDVILTSGTLGTLAAKQATESIPIVTAIAGEPVAAGLVSSLAKPGGNVTGLSTLAPELEGKRLELFKQAVPKLSRVVALLNPARRERRGGRRAEDPAELGAALFGDMAEAILVGGGVKAGGQAHIAHDVLGVGEARDGAEDDPRGESRQRADAGMRKEAWGIGMDQGGGGNGGIERLDLGVKGSEQLETVVASLRGIGRQRERLQLHQPGVPEELGAARASSKVRSGPSWSR